MSAAIDTYQELVDDGRVIPVRSDTMIDLSAAKDQSDVIILISVTPAELNGTNVIFTS